MTQIQRLYDPLLQNHLQAHQEMAFLAGPRQVGKTTIAKGINKSYYNNWDNIDDRRLLLEGPRAIVDHYLKSQLLAEKPVLIFDELHKNPHWKNFIKGFYDTYGSDIHIIVTGSSRLDLYRKGGDSLMGRYFPYRIHPLSVGELLRPGISSELIQAPKEIPNDPFETLLKFGGFPKPFLSGQQSFWRRWQSLRREQLFRQDIRDLMAIQEIAKLEMLSTLLAEQVGGLCAYSSLAKKIGVSIATVSRWIEVLINFYDIFPVRPYSKNITRALLKEPKYFLWDWSLLKDPGARLENFVASHLLKAIHLWTDSGQGEFELFFLRDKEKREVDFLVTQNQEPWFLVEVKSSSHQGLSPSLAYFQAQTQAKHAFQVVFDLAYVDRDCFTVTEPVIVPAKTFLSQLV